MNRIKDLFSKNEFTKNIFVLISLTSIGQIISVISILILAKFYTITDFGNYAVFISINALIAISSTARLELALVLPKEDEEAVKIMKIGLFITLIYVIVLALILMTIYYQIGIKNIYWFYMPFSVSATSIQSFLQYFSLRIKTYQVFGYSGLIQSLVFFFISLILSFTSLKINGLITAFIVGQLSSIIWYYFNLRDKLKFFSISMEASILKKYLDFPKYFIASEFLMTSYQQLMPLLLSHYYNLHIVGHFAMGNRLIKAPSSFIAGAIGNLFRNDAQSEITKTESMNNIFNLTLKRLLVVGFVCFGFFFLIPQKLYEQIIGVQWSEISFFIKILIPYVFAEFVATPLSETFILRGKQKTNLIINIVYVTLFLLLVFIVHYFFNNYIIDLVIFVFIFSCLNITRIIDLQ